MCGLSTTTDRVINGEETGISQFPWMVGMYHKSERRFFCGASIISNRWILSAAHCFNDRTKDEIEAHLGEHDTSISDETELVKMEIEEIINNPKYDITALELFLAGNPL